MQKIVITSLLLSLVTLSARAELGVLPVQPGRRETQEANTPPITIVEKLNSQVPLDAKLIDSDGQATTFGEILATSKKPVILTLGYYECPMLCDIVLNAALTGVKKLEYTLGQEYEVISVSIEPKETHVLAGQKRENYLKKYGREVKGHGWHFTTGTAEDTKRIADAVGWQYAWDDKTEQYAHAAGIFVLTPAGKVSRVLYGIEFLPRDLKFALLEAGEGRVGTAIDRLILWCYHYDAKDRTYIVFAFRVMRVGGALSVLALALTVILLLRSERRRRQQTGANA